MSLSITVAEGNVQQGVKDLRVRISGPGVRQVMARAGADVLRGHFTLLNRTRQNRLGGRRTGFYAQAMRGTQSRVDLDAMILSVNQVGIRQRYYGGTIVPKQAKALAIPVNPAAYGKRPREFNDLELVVDKEAGAAYLVRRRQTVLRRTRRGLRGVELGGEIFYVLKRAVYQEPDPSVLPTREALLEPMTAAGLSYLTRRRGGAQ